MLRSLLHGARTQYTQAANSGRTSMPSVSAHQRVLEAHRLAVLGSTIADAPDCVHAMSAPSRRGRRQRRSVGSV